MDMERFLEFLKVLGYDLGLLAAAMVVALLAHKALTMVLLRLSKRSKSPHDELTIQRCTAPTRWLVVAAAVWLVMDLAYMPEGLAAFLRHLISVSLIFLTAWLLLRILRVARDVFLARYDMAAADNLHARAIHTQMRVLERIVLAVVVIIAFGCMLMTFDGVRQLGVSLLASAGIVGIVLGLAAQKVIGTLFAGLQMAITQPIRLDDIVIVEGEWGVIEEITLTYIVMRLWDLRRLVVPMTYFMEKPFENWTRVSAELIGTVFLYVDAAAPIEPIRQELQSLLKASPLWDGKACALQVTNVTDRTVEVRALMSAANASAVWDLRCAVREGLLEFIRSRHAAALPRVRFEGTDAHRSAGSGDPPAGQGAAGGGVEGVVPVDGSM
jgi:small-conductance mechanosensitive channel